MKKLFKGVLLNYVIIIGLTMLSIGLILSHVVTDQVLLILILTIGYAVFLVLLLHFYDRFIKPINHTTEAVGQLVEGNYHARVQSPATATLGTLNNKLN